MKKDEGIKTNNYGHKEIRKKVSISREWWYATRPWWRRGAKFLIDHRPLLAKFKLYFALSCSLILACNTMSAPLSQWLTGMKQLFNARCCFPALFGRIIIFSSIFLVSESQRDLERRLKPRSCNLLQVWSRNRIWTSILGLRVIL